MIVCICKGVSDSTVRELLNHIDLPKVKEVTGASTQCGTCSQLPELIASESKDNKQLSTLMVDALIMDDMNGNTCSYFCLVTIGSDYVYF